MLNDVIASPDPFINVTCALCEVQGSSGEPAKPDILWEVPVRLHRARQLAQCLQEHAGSLGHPREVFY